MQGSQHGDCQHQKQAIQPLFIDEHAREDGWPTAKQRHQRNVVIVLFAFGRLFAFQFSHIQKRVEVDGEYINNQ